MRLCRSGSLAIGLAATPAYGSAAQFADTLKALRIEADWSEAVVVRIDRRLFRDKLCSSRNLIQLPRLQHLIAIEKRVLYWRIELRFQLRNLREQTALIRLGKHLQSLS